jgi:hypothetical protein
MSNLERFWKAYPRDNWDESERQRTNDVFQSLSPSDQQLAIEAAQWFAEFIAVTAGHVYSPAYFLGRWRSLVKPFAARDWWGWYQEFYLIPASQTSKEQAAAHSLRKWRGALPENLAKYNLKKPPIVYGAGTCALCKHNTKCVTCPLCQMRGDVPCDAPRLDERLSPYASWTEEHNPLPMIEWLERTVAAEAK